MEYIIAALVTAWALCGLAVLFGKRMLKKKCERKWVKCGIAAVCLAASSVLTAIIAYRLLLFDSYGKVLEATAIGLLGGTLLSFVAVFFARRWWKAVCLLGLPGYSFCFLCFILLAGLGDAGFPLTQHEARYTTQEEVEALLGVDDLPKMKFDYATKASYGKRTKMVLLNEADSTRLKEISERIMAERPLQNIGTDYAKGVYMTADNDAMEYADVVWVRDGILLVYGSIWGKDSSNKEQFDSIGAPLPEYRYIAFDARPYGGPDWNHNERIEFERSVPLEWLEKVKAAAKKNEQWSYKEDKDCYDISFDDYRIYTKMKLYKRLGGRRKIADINWGDY